MRIGFVILWLCLFCTSDCIPKNLVRNHIERNHRNAALNEDGDNNDSTKEPTLPEVCGQYGFRCIDEQSFQVCRYIDIDGQMEEPQAVHQCQEDLICDEDNIAYCTPRFRLADSMPGTGTIERKPCTGLLDLDPAQLRKARNISKEFVCKEFGLFADFTNKSMFWFCERDCKTKSFKQRHMFCKHGRIFDEDCKQCVAPMHKVPATIPPTASQLPTGFTCSGRHMGKYADTMDCQKYHICLPRSRASMGTSFNQIVLLCPEGTAYNAQSEQCDAAARTECSSDPELDSEDRAVSDRESDNGHQECEPGSRAMDVSQTDCGGYTLCTGKRLISVRCPRNHRFDESEQKCRPAALVDC